MFSMVVNTSSEQKNLNNIILENREKVAKWLDILSIVYDVERVATEHDLTLEFRLNGKVQTLLLKIMLLLQLLMLMIK